MLKEELGYRGLVLSDDLDMKAISGRYSLEEATVMAIEAGCDAVLMCGEDQDVQARSIEAVIRAVESQRISVTRAEDALARHRRVKERFLARTPAPLSGAALRAALGRDEALSIADEMSRFA
jgi:beta-N-acetylhexosaminidase